MDQPRSSLRPSEAEIKQSISALVDAIRKLFEHLKQDAGLEPQKVFSFLTRVIEDPEGVKRDLVAESLKSDPKETREGIEFTTNFVRSPRKVAMPILKEAFPAGTPGRRPQITEPREAEMLRLAATLLPAAQALVELRNVPSRRSTKESLAYLQSDHPEAIEIFLSHELAVQRFFAQIQKQPKNLKARARHLVLQVIATEFDISPAYARRWIGAALRS